MLVSADWVLPITRRPIKCGALLVQGEMIAEVATVDELTARYPDEEHIHYEDCVVLPGLVNAHTHLSLSAMQDLIEPADFEKWLPRLVVAMHAWETADFAASAAAGALHCLEAGVTVVGDIAYGPESAQAAIDLGLGGVAYWEILGVTAPSLFAELERLGFPADGCEAFGPRLRCGVSPHSIYTSPPDLLVAVHRAAIELGLPSAIHLAESPAETRLALHGDGPLVTTARRLIGDFEVPGVTPIAYLDRLGVLDGMTAVHLGETEPFDVPRLAATVRGVVTCPRSNRFLGNRVAPVDRFVAAGVPVGVGTDSSASNEDLDLLEELRLLQQHFPELTGAQLLEFVTLQGAVALGEEHRFGALEPGMLADIAVFNLGATADPEGDLVQRGGRDTVHAVMSSGVWRIAPGIRAQLPAQTMSAVASAREKAVLALAQ